MTELRLGLLRLADSAPLLLAEAEGLFAQHGIEAALSVEPSWANVLDKLAYGLLDAAALPASLALAAALGLRQPSARIVVPMGLSQGGNAVVAAPAIAAALDGGPAAPLETGRRLAQWMRAQEAPPRFAVVHAFSTHNLLLRYWLAASGADSDQIMRTVIVPPERIVDVLAEGAVAGFCAGAPWGELAQQGGHGRVLLGGSSIWAGHPEKCLALSEAWAGANPGAVTGLLRALLRAGPLCDEPDRAPPLARLLADRLGLPEAACRAALPGGGGAETIRFAAGGGWFPWRSQAAWFAGQIQRWGWLEGSRAAAAAIYRPELLREAAAAEDLPWPEADAKPEGGHGGAWSIAASPLPMQLCADRFVDEARFSTEGVQLPARTAVNWAMD